MADTSKIVTKELNADSIAEGMRVQINNNEEHHRELGTVNSVNQGCSCSSGWCKVLLDKETQSGDYIIEEFRFGYRGDVSDLLQVVKEPPRPKIKGKHGQLVTPETAIPGTEVRIWEGSRFFGQSKKVGKIIRLAEYGWCKVDFGGYGNNYRYGLPLYPSDLVLA